MTVRGNCLHGDMYQFDEVPKEPHNSEADRDCFADLCELYRVRERARSGGHSLLNDSFGSTFLRRFSATVDKLQVRRVSGYMLLDL